MLVLNAMNFCSIYSLDSVKEEAFCILFFSNIKKNAFAMSQRQSSCVFHVTNIQGLGLWCLMLLFNNIWVFLVDETEVHVYRKTINLLHIQQKSPSIHNVVFCDGVSIHYLASICLLVVSLSE